MASPTTAVFRPCPAPPGFRPTALTVPLNLLPFPIRNRSSPGPSPARNKKAATNHDRLRIIHGGSGRRAATATASAAAAASDAETRTANIVNAPTPKVLLIIHSLAILLFRNGPTVLRAHPLPSDICRPSRGNRLGSPWRIHRHKSSSCRILYTVGEKLVKKYFVSMRFFMV